MIACAIPQLQNIKKCKKNEQELNSINEKIQNLIHEKERIIDAFREGIISKNELKSQLAKIEKKRESLEEQKKLNKNLDLPTETIISSIYDYCNLIAKYLKNADFDSKRYILSMVVSNITLLNRTATIIACLPVADRRIASITSLWNEFQMFFFCLD